jgi:hypothetical protein
MQKQYIGHLEEQVENLKKELADIKTQLSERSDAAKKQNHELEEKFQQQVKSVESLKARLLEMQAGNARQLTSVTAFSIMKEAAMRGEPFEYEFRQVAALANNPQQKAHLAALEPYAEKGIGNMQELKSQFDSTLPKALAPERKAHSLATSLSSLIQIRREGEQQQGMDDESVLARAEAKIHRDEVAAAIKEMKALSPPAADVFSGWLQKAQFYMDGRNALDALQLALLKGKAPAMPKAAPEAPAKAAEKPAPAPAASAPAAADNKHEDNGQATQDATPDHPGADDDDQPEQPDNPDEQ